MSNKKFDFLNRLEELPSRLYIILGIIFLANHTVLGTYTEIKSTTSGLLLISLYIVIVGVIFFFSRRRMAIYKAESRAAEEQNSGVIAAFRDSVDLPYAVITNNGTVVTVNSAMKDITGNKDTYFNLNISSLCDINYQKLIVDVENPPEQTQTDESDEESAKSESKTLTVSIGKNKYDVSCHPVRSNGHTYYMLVFDDVTKLTEITDIHFAETPAVAYIVIDNLEEIAQYVKGSYRAEANQVQNILKDFAENMDGVLREYDRDKYMMIFDRKHLAACIKNKFEILDAVRQVRIGDDSIPVTVSMGIAITGSTLAEREHDALSSLDLALQRGGDQVVVKNEKGVNYFGGLTKSQQKRTRVHSRIIANKLCSEISNATNVLVMGHSNPDFDSLGACVGIAALAMYVGVDVKIVTDTQSPSFLSCTEKLVELEEYRNIFVDGVDGMDKYSYGTLVVIVDANNFSILESPELAHNALRTVVIDHHIKKEEFKNEPVLAYIDPSASSASELVSEILEQSFPAGTLKKEEATVLLSGIMVDTKNFTRTVGTRTFSAALYLRGAGANVEVARTFFEEAFDDYRSEALFGAGVEIYRGELAITTSEGTGSPHDRVAAAKAADKLLTVKQVNAAFALVRVGDVIHVSARSNGKINVQLILEKIGGGGHFDVAGAAVADRSLEEAKELLLGAIDKHFEQLSQNGKKAPAAQKE
ncbi:MAG: DHH family phosphoesterase [Clostridia bacterium]|nr:DHH family phosphoesterase [Clostridia bacterium]